MRNEALRGYVRSASETAEVVVVHAPVGRMRIVAQRALHPPRGLLVCKPRPTDARTSAPVQIDPATSAPCPP